MSANAPTRHLYTDASDTPLPCGTTTRCLQTLFEVCFRFLGNVKCYSSFEIAFTLFIFLVSSQLLGRFSLNNKQSKYFVPYFLDPVNNKTHTVYLGRGRSFKLLLHRLQCMVEYSRCDITHAAIYNICVLHKFVYYSCTICKYGQEIRSGISCKLIFATKSKRKYTLNQ